MKAKDIMIQQFLSTSVPLPLTMMQDELFGKLLKANVQKEDDAAPPVAL